MFQQANSINLNAVVVDVGSEFTKIGYGGEDAPRIVAPSVVGIVNDSKSYPNKLTHDVNTYHDHMDIQHFMYDGNVLSYEEYENNLSFLLRDKLKVKMKETPLLLLEKSSVMPLQRQKLTEYAFESLQTPGFFLGKDATMAIYCCGRSSGLAVDFGADTVTITPVVDGYVEQKAITKCYVGTRLLEDYMLSLIQQKVIKTNHHINNNNNNNSMQVDEEGVLPVYHRYRVTKEFPLETFQQLSQTAGTGTTGTTTTTTTTGAVSASQTSTASVNTKASNATATVATSSSTTTTTTETTTIPVFTTKVIPRANMSTSFDRYHSLELGRNIKDSCCRLLDSNNNSNSSSSNGVSNTLLTTVPPLLFELPDGRTVEVDGERFEVPELYFEPTVLSLAFNQQFQQQQRALYPATAVNHATSSSPSSSSSSSQPTTAPATTTTTTATSGLFAPINPLEWKSVARAVVDAAFKCGNEQAFTMFTNIVVTGGGASFETLPERLRTEVEAILRTVAPSMRVKTTAVNTNDRYCCSFLGGSIVASFGAAQDFFISKREYEEKGSLLVHLKCP